MEVNPRIAKLNGAHILYDFSLLAKPFKGLFSPAWLDTHGMLVGETRGRGEGYFLCYEKQEWVLRHYLRGGLANKFLKDEFVGWRLNKTRAWSEWRLLANLYRKGFPVPRPVAACVSRSFGFYRCDLITGKIPNTQTLAGLLEQNPLPARVWTDIGSCLSRFHSAGVYHADLNANNILLDDQGRVYLIDFDRGRLCRPGTWRKKNIDRLERSLCKIARLSPKFYFLPENWHCLISSYISGISQPEK